MMVAMSLAVAWHKPPVWFMDIAGGGLGGWNATAALGPLVRDQGAAALTLYQGFGLLPMFGKNGSCHNRGLPQLADLNAHLAKMADDRLFVYQRLFCLPSSAQLEDADIRHIVASVLAQVKKQSASA